MVADQLDYVVGVDPHRDQHALGVVEVRSGVVVFETAVVADSGGSPTPSVSPRRMRLAGVCSRSKAAAPTGPA